MRVAPRNTLGRRWGPMTGWASVAGRRRMRERAGRRSAASLAGILVLGLVAGCGGAAAPATGLPSPAAPSPIAAAAAGAAGGPAMTPGMSPDQQLVTAFAPLSAGYSFDTVVTLGGQVAARVNGRRIGSASEMTLQSGGSSVAYRMLPPRSFVQEPDGTWVEADGQVPDADPLAALRAPLSVAGVPGAGGGLRVTYPASALGLTGDQPTTVFLKPAADGTVSATWTATINGREAVSTTLLGPASGAPILDPTAQP